MRSLRRVCISLCLALIVPLPGIAQNPGGGSEAGAARVPAAPDAGGPRYWKVAGAPRGLNLRDGPALSARRVAAYPEGTILNNLGCESAAGRNWCDVQEVGGGPRGYVAAEFLVAALAPDGSIPSGPDESALRAGRGDFDATGRIPCARFAGQPMGQCEFGVARAGAGDATVVVTHADGRTRAIFFQLGRAMSADQSQADGYGEFRIERESELNLVRVGDERYEIPDAVIFADSSDSASELTSPPAAELTGAVWHLVQIMSMDDNTYEPESPDLYTLELAADGTMSLRADCNRGAGSWSSESPGQLRFGVIAATQAMCAPGSLHDRYLSQFEWVRSYVMRDGRLFLATMADGAIIEFERRD